MRSGLIFGACLAVAATTAAPSYAQEGKRFQAQFSVRALYDDNVSRSSAGVAALRGLQQDDTLYSPSLTLDVSQPIGRQVVFLSGVVGYNFYENNDELNRERIALRGGVSSVLGPCATSLTSEFNRAQSELDDLTIGEVKNTETSTGVGLSATCGRQIGFAPTGSVNQRWSKNSSPIRETAEYQELNASFGIAYRRPTFGELSLVGTYGKTEYDDPLAPVGPAASDNGFESYGVNLRFNRRLGARIQGTANVGYTNVRPTLNAVDDFEGFTYGLDVNYRASDRISASAAFSRSVTPANRLQSTYSVADMYSLRGSYALSSRISFTLGASYADKSYEGPALIAGTSVTQDEVRSIDASVAFDISRRLSISMDASQVERDANVRGVDYTANRIGVSLVATY